MQIIDMSLDTALTRRVHATHGTSPSRFATQYANTHVNKLTE